MIALLRKIRRSLIESGSARKYLLYAFGEIALVVIGILIALQINNWNIYRKERVRENDVLKELVVNMETNIKLINRRVERIDEWNHSGFIINKLIEEGGSYHDSLDFHFHLSIINGGNLQLSYGGYERLKSVGFDIILDAEIRKAVQEIFELTYKRLSMTFDWHDHDVPEYKDFIDQEFYRISPKTGFKPYSYQKVITDNYYNSLIKKAIAQRNWAKVNLNENIKASEKVKSLIQNKKGI